VFSVIGCKVCSVKRVQEGAEMIDSPHVTNNVCNSQFYAMVLTMPHDNVGYFIASCTATLALLPPRQKCIIALSQYYTASWVGYGLGVRVSASYSTVTVYFRPIVITQDIVCDTQGINHFRAFLDVRVPVISDDLNIMTGHKSGDAVQLAMKYPNIVMWHC